MHVSTFCDILLDRLGFADCVGRTIERPFVTTCNFFDNIDPGTGEDEQAPGSIERSPFLPDAETLRRICCRPAVWMMSVIVCLAGVPGRFPSDEGSMLPDRLYDIELLVQKWRPDTAFPCL